MTFSSYPHQFGRGDVDPKTTLAHTDQFGSSSIAFLDGPGRGDVAPIGSRPLERILNGEDYFQRFVESSRRALQ